MRSSVVSSTGKKSGLSRILTSILATGALVAGGLVVSVAAAPIAAADPGPVVPITATMPTADSLPTVQVDGVVWSQQIIGNTVYVGGQFTNARPAGAAPGTSLTARSNMLSYNLTTGALNTGFNPAPNQQIYAMAASPDGTRLYVAGMFTSIGGGSRARVASINLQTGALITTFNAGVDYTVKSIAATNTAVYVGGAFTNSGKNARTRLAAFDPTTGALLGWAPTADSTVNALVASPDGAIIAGGVFQNVNGQPAYGLAKLSASDGSMLPWNATDTVRDAGPNAAITSLKTDGTSIFGSGYVFGAGGNLEGAFSANPSTGNINYLEDCHGDTYDLWPGQNALYTVSHDHYCGNIGGFPQSDPWSVNMRHALAYTKSATGTAGHDPYGYFDFYGTPTPSLMHWFPELQVGTYTKKSQAAWSITGNSQYVLMGGEFPSINGVGQQGLARFAVKPIAPAKQGPQYTGSKTNPTVSGVGDKVRVAWQANTDEDNDTLSYKLYRDGTVVYSTSAKSNYWTRPTLGFFDSGLVPGTTYRYQLVTTDPDGNTTSSLQIPFKAPTSDPQTAYSKRVLADGAGPYWPLRETTGSIFFDSSGFDDADAFTSGKDNPNLTRGVAGAIAGDAATGFDGTTSSATRDAVTAPDTFTAQAWINTTSSTGGKILGFGNSEDGTSTSYDRHIYMDNAGHIYFGVYPGGARTVNSTGTYNDGQWHQITASLGADGMNLYVDDKLVGQRSDTTSGQPFTGYWRIGGDSLGGWPNQPSSNNFAGSIDEVAIYPTVLSRATVDAQWVASGRPSTLPKAPADAYGAAVFDDNPLLFWRLGESSGTTAKDSGPDGGQTGLIQGGVTLGQPGGIKGTSDTAAGFNGSDGLVASTNSFSNPKNFSEEAWFKTTTTNGGKIIGFGSSQSGTSGSYDRHVYMDASGAVTFGVWTGQTNTITAPGTFNDGAWHHVVATQSTTDGMKLYLDGQLAGTNPQTDAQDYSGYWRVGGDNQWGSGGPFIAATIDDVAVYNAVLTAAQIAQHFNLGSSTAPVNQAPTAAFTSTVTDLSAAFDASTSADADGTVASYAWDFGDGTTGTGVKPTHPYTKAGTYTAKLTVTDNDGATGTVSHAVTVTDPAPVNQAPTAAFTSTVSDLSAAFDASTSADADGTVASYAWDFGDGTTGTGVKPTHPYTKAGTYTAKLTVTDNDGATGTVSHAVTVTAAPPANKPPVSLFTVSSMQLTSSFDGSGSSDPDGAIASYAWTFGDGASSTESKPNHTFAAAGTYPVTLTVTDNDGATGSSTQQVQVTAPPANKPPVASFTVAKTDLTVNLESTSTDSDGTIVSTAWDFGDNTTGTDTAEVHTYAAAGTYPITLTVKDDAGATATKTTSVTVTATPPANQPPVAAFSSTSSGLTASLNGSASSDPDGTIKSYSWDFGDSSNDLTTTSATSHPYAAAGTYQVTLTVTDNAGATDSVVHPVTVSAPAPAALIKDTFSRTTSGGWGSADTGGPWTVLGGNGNFAVGGGVGTIKMAAPGAGPSTTIAAPTAADVDITLDTSIDKAPTGGGVFLQLGARKVGNSEYRETVKLLSDGRVQLQLVKIANGTSTTLKAATVAGLTYAAGDVLTVRFQVAGDSSVALNAKVWKAGATEPAAWTMTAADSSSPLSTTGSISLYPYLSGSATAGAVTAAFDNLTVSGVAP